MLTFPQWIDNCCIDKKNSVELAEAINSMFRWYNDAGVCYVYLDDVKAVGNNEESYIASFNASRWFTRGWTLQELIAPAFVVFYSQDWSELGTRSSILRPIHLATGIDQTLLGNTGTLSRFSVAQKLSWASRRRTSRIEDEAYCLLGLFDLNMPLIYGEGERAFLRLQEEILKRSSDHTIFAWDSNGQQCHGVLADSPRAFEHSAHFIQRPFDADLPPYSITNGAIHITFPVQTTEFELICTPALKSHCSVQISMPYIAILNCGRSEDTDDGFLGLALGPDDIDESLIKGPLIRHPRLLKVGRNHVQTRADRKSLVLQPSDRPTQSGLDSWRHPDASTRIFLKVQNPEAFFGFKLKSTLWVRLATTAYNPDPGLIALKTSRRGLIMFESEEAASSGLLFEVSISTGILWTGLLANPESTNKKIFSSFRSLGAPSCRTKLGLNIATITVSQEKRHFGLCYDLKSPWVLLKYR